MEFTVNSFRHPLRCLRRHLTISSYLSPLSSLPSNHFDILVHSSIYSPNSTSFFSPSFFLSIAFVHSSTLFLSLFYNALFFSQSFIYLFTFPIFKLLLPSSLSTQLLSSSPHNFTTFFSHYSFLLYFYFSSIGAPHFIFIDFDLTFLFQLRKLAYAIKKSTTIILPRWYEIIELLEQAALASASKNKLTVCKMPRDVSTRWNSTYDMLKFATIYCEPIDKITDDRSMKLRDYELKDDEWKIVEELRDCLKVFFSPFFFVY